MKSLEESHLHGTIPENFAGKRIDQAWAELFPQYSRMRLKSWLETGEALINGKHRKPKDKIAGNEEVIIHATVELACEDTAENIPLNIIFEDESLIVINKPVGLVVHPAAGNRSSTLLNALLYHAPELANLPRAGIIHRIDKETSGLLIIAKTLEAQTDLVKQLQAREITREYEAIIQGTLTGGGSVSEPIGRHSHHRTKMAVVANGKPATTHYWVIERFQSHTHIRVKLETGRTHQIRVHMEHINHPLVGDPTYGGRMKLPKGASDELISMLKDFKRQALHARRLEFMHPVTKEPMALEAELPEDMESLLKMLKKVSDIT